MSTHSTGPRTDAGKERSSQNAFQHGLCSEQPVMPNEDPAAWQAFHDGVLLELEPVGLLETELAERIALHHWRRRRVARFETKVGFDQYKAALREATGAMIGLSPDDPDWQELLQAHRDVESSQRDLQTEEETRALLEQLPTMPDEAVLDEDLVLYLLDLLGQTSIVEINGVATAAMVRRELPKTAQKTLADTLTFLLAACEEDRQETTSEIATRQKRFERVAEKMAKHAESVAHEHNLLQRPELERVVRYEAHVSRQLRFDQEALDKMQEKRRARAQSAPLSPVLRGEGLGVRGGAAEEDARPHPSPLTPLPGVPGRGEELRPLNPDPAHASIPEAVARRSQLPPRAEPAKGSSFRSGEEVLAALGLEQPSPEYRAWPETKEAEFVPQFSTKARNGHPVLGDVRESS